MYDIRQTDRFRKWLGRVRDPMSRALREHTGPGYRIYFTIRPRRLILLIAGGDKSSQELDINLARSMIERLEKDA